MPVDRVFVDTNVLLSGLIFAGNEAQLLQLGIDGRVRLVIAEVVLAEARAVLAAKFPRHAGVLDDFLSLLDFEHVPAADPESVRTAAVLCRDADDAAIVASIVLARPDYAVTGDKDLLTDEVRQTVPVCRCSEYLSQRTAAQED